MTPRPNFVESECRRPSARLKITRFDLREPIDSLVFNDDCYFDMCLTPRPHRARGCYVGHFAPSHFEPFGHLMFVPAGIPMRARCESGRPWALQCWFAAETFAELTPSWDKDRLRESLDVRRRSLTEASVRIVAEMTDPGFARDVVIDAACAFLTVDLIRHFSDRSGKTAPHRGGLPAWRLRRIEERVCADGAPPMLAELAALCAMSPRHLTRAYREQTGRTIGAFIEESRLERAKNLLSADVLSLKEIAEQLGFAQTSAFSAAFRRACRERPSAYRARLRA